MFFCKESDKRSSNTDPLSPLNIPPIQKFSKSLLRNWYGDMLVSYESRNFLQKRLDIEKLLKDTEDGLPEFVYEEVCEHFGYSWEGEVATCLK